MSRTPADATAQLAGVLSAAPPPSLAEVEPAVVARLAEAVRTEGHRQVQAIERAVDDALRLVPRPLRGIVKRLVRP
ncbi:hypothetical protein [Euzebya sp.]|uniref:hypothetical protein n=1 Tax=Euzebya sp. TaxID=1971409 RepID=UPI0035147A97